jgi:hypothetical protein
VDPAKVERRIEKEPAWVGRPRYALFVFDRAAHFRVWAALDRTKAGLAYEDVLYFDRNGNGDLTEDGERITSEWNEDMADAGMGISFRVGDVAVPGVDEKHTDFLVCPVPKKGRKGVWFRMKWRGRFEISGAYGLVGMDTIEWGASPAEAPVLRPTAEGPLSFALWETAPVTLASGGEHLNVLIGHRTQPGEPLCVVDENFVDLEEQFLSVEVVAKDRAGREVRKRSPICDHC